MKRLMHVYSVRNHLSLCLVLIIALLSINWVHAVEIKAIQHYEKNTYYWQYKGQPVLLIGGSDDDGLFQMPDIKKHLEEIAAVGGNYVRNVMSQRASDAEFEVAAFKKNVNDQFDLDQWNNEFWIRFENFLKITDQLDIIVQVELWAFHDFSRSKKRDLWSESPWHPNNNINYTTSSTKLKKTYKRTRKAKHDFFFSVPKLNNDVVLLGYQHKFVDKLLSISLKYDNVLYTMTNEIFKQYSPEWGWYWSDYIKTKAKTQNKKVETAEMYWQTDLTSQQPKAALDHPDIFSFVEISQNSINDGETHWNNIQYVRDYIESSKRPMNNTKMYGSDEVGGGWGTNKNVVQRYWRNVIGGSASMRFHRPPVGMGLNNVSKNTFKATRKLETLVKMWEVEPAQVLLSRRTENEAYLAAKPGEKYALYFTEGGSVDLDLKKHTGTFDLYWINIDTGQWGAQKTINGGARVTIRAPDKGPWVAGIVRQLKK